MNDNNSVKNNKDKKWFPKSITSNILLSIGIPGGLLYLEEMNDVLGYVRNGVQVVEMNEENYAMWVELLKPTEKDTISKIMEGRNAILENIVSFLEQKGLLLILEGVVNSDYEKVSKLRPIPIGMTWTTSDDDLNFTNVVSSEGNIRLALSPLAFAFWSLCDYSRSISEIFEKMVLFYHLDQDFIKQIILGTLLMLMENRLIFIDSGKRDTQGDGE